MKNITLFDLKKRDKIELFRLVSELRGDALINYCEDLLNNSFKLHGRYPKVDLNADNIWIMDPFDRTWRFILHSQTYLEYLIDGYEKSKEIKYINKALDFIWDWKKNNLTSSKSEMAWHDHSTALRLIIICKIFESWKVNNWDEEVFSDILELVRAHCLKLANPDFYMEKHNHGMDQDIALLISSITFPILEESNAWKSLALYRFKGQLDHLFASDGTYFEHSPDYVNALAIRLFNVFSFIKKNKIDNDLNLGQILKNAMKYFSYMLQPDGQIPAIGDSVLHPVDLRKLNDCTGELLKNVEFISSNCTKGEQPGNLDIVFSEGGYAVLRNKWKYDEDTVQAIFYSSFHSRVHKHHDDLSVTLFGHGQSLLVDAGKYNYVYDSKERQYIVSTKAHNTVIVDNENTNTSKKNIGKSGLTEYYLDKNFSFISGTHCLYPGVVHNRVFLFFKPYDFLVIDILKGYKEHNFEQNFHFDPSIRCESNNNVITGFIGKKSVISLKQIYNLNETQVKLVKGDEEPLFGWVSPSYAQLEPTFCMSSIQNGKDARFVTHITLNPDNPLSVDFQWKDEFIDIKCKGKSIKLILGESYNYLVLGDQLLNLIYIDHPNIKEAIDDQKNYEFREKYRAERKRRLKYQEDLENLKIKIAKDKK